MVFQRRSASRCRNQAEFTKFQCEADVGSCQGSNLIGDEVPVFFGTNYEMHPSCFSKILGEKLREITIYLPAITLAL